MSTHDRARGGTGKAEAMSPVRLVLPVQWGEMDAYGHVNNVVYFRWFESARMAYFARLGWPEVERATGVGPILHSTRARFRAPLEWPDEVEVTTRAVEVGEDRFTMLYEIRSRALGRVAAEGEGLIVAFDYRSKRKAALPLAVRERLAALEGPGVTR
ncbi:MAG: acyl-CoA thioesterase [Acidobacteria bacterium]|nr:acyl-CoA thioesterase [Acidobacteriota bacterium]